MCASLPHISPHLTEMNNISCNHLDWHLSLPPLSLTLTLAHTVEGHLEVAALLIKEGGADVHAKDINGRTPLHWAASVLNGWEMRRGLWVGGEAM